MLEQEQAKPDTKLIEASSQARIITPRVETPRVEAAVKLPKLDFRRVLLILSTVPLLAAGGIIASALV